MFVKKLLMLVTVIEVAVGVQSVPSPSPAELTTDEIVQRPKDLNKAFIDLNHIKPTYNFRYGSKIYDPNSEITTGHYELRYNDVNLGIFNRVGTNGDRLSTVNFTIDATNGYRATFSADSLEELKTLDYAHFTSPLATATPPNDGKEAFTSFPIADKENIEKHSPQAASAYKTHNVVKGYYNFVPTITYNWGYEIDGMVSQYETYRGDNGEGRVTLVNADGCVSSMDYTVDATHFNVSTIRTFGKQDIKQLYLNPKHYPLLLQIAHGSSACNE